MPNSSISKFTRKEIVELHKKSKLCFSSEVLNIKIAPKLKESARVLIIAPRNIGNAPKRNLIRRRIKSIFYEESFTSGSFDYIMFCKKNITKLPFQELKGILIKTKNECPN